MKQFGYFHAMMMSFYSRALYRDVVKNWGGRVFLYLLLVLVLYAAVMTYSVQSFVNVILPPVLEKYLSQAPEVVVKDGMVSTPENRPYLISNPDDKKIVAIIDTTGVYKNLDNSEADFLLTKNAVIMRDKNVMRTYSLDKSMDADLKPEVLKAKALRAASWGWVALFPIFLILAYIYRLIQALFYALLGKILSLIMSVPLSYFDILKLSMVAVTPAIILKLLVEVSIGSFPMAWLVYFLLSMAYLIFAISSLKED